MRQVSSGSPAGDRAEGPVEPFRWWQLVGFGLLGVVVLLGVAGSTNVAVFGWVWVVGVVVWPFRWSFQRQVRGRPVWWLLVVWPAVPFVWVGMGVWSVLEVLSGF